MAVTWNPADFNSVPGETITFSNGNLTITASGTGGSQTNIRSTAPGESTGKFYFEDTLVLADTNGFTGVGICSTDNPGTGTGSVYINFLQNGDWFGSTGSGTIYSYTTGAVVQIAVDLGANLAWFRTGTNAWNNNGSADPATGVGGLTIPSFAGKSITPFCRLGGSGGTGGSWTGNWGASSYSQSAPAGFSNWPSTLTPSTANFFFGA